MIWLRLANYGRIQLAHVVSFEIAVVAPYTITVHTVDGRALDLLNANGYASVDEAQAAIDSFIVGDSLRTP